MSVYTFDEHAKMIAKTYADLAKSHGPAGAAAILNAAAVMNGHHHDIEWFCSELHNALDNFTLKVHVLNIDER